MSDAVDSYYEATRHGAGESDAFEPGRFDVAVIGGGLTGLNAAIELAGRGVRACLLEGHAIGWGASGRSGGQVIAGLGVDMDWLARRLGDDVARALFAIALQGMDDLRRRIASHGIECDLVDGHLVAAHNRRAARSLRREAESMNRRYDYPVRYLDGGALAEQVGSTVYHGGLYDDRSGHLHPLNYTLGVAQIARAAGVKIFAGCRVERVIGDGPHRVRCEAGEIACDHVLLCANAYLDRLEPKLARHFIPVGSHIVATRPLDESTANSLLPGNAAVADTRRVLDYYRLSADRRLLFGGRVGLLDPTPAQLRSVMASRIARVFPALEGIQLDHAWGGHVAVTRSHAPHLGRLRGNILFAHGYSGHGMVLSGIAGKVLAEAVAGDDDRLRLLARIPNPAIRMPRRLLKPALAVMLAWFRLLDRT